MRTLIATITVLLGGAEWVFGQTSYRSHPPMRPLPAPSARPMDQGPALFVDAVNGSDRADGSKAKPWKTLAHAVQQLKPGDTLYLRGGVYHEQVRAAVSGTAEKPIAIRSFPGELAIVDGGLREFHTDPANAWEAAPAGADDEYRSTRTYPELAEAEPERGVHVCGNFTDSMIPLHGYRYLVDFRSDNRWWNIAKNDSTDKGIYLGPGLWYDRQSKRIHVRLTHTSWKYLGEENYHGEKDPRKLRLIVAGPNTPLRLDKVRHWRVQDLAIRGSRGPTVSISDASDIDFSGVTIYAGSPALHVRATENLRLIDCVLRGVSAPWSSRASNKYRGLSSYLLIVGRDLPQCSNFEMAHCEFTDNHDGLILGTMKKLRFHHNYVDNFDDDGIYLTLSRARPPEDLQFFENFFSRSHTTFSFAESGMGVKNEVGTPVYIYRNVFDFRRGTLGSPPASAEAGPNIRQARVASDHGSPVWDPVFFYHNTVLSASVAADHCYAAGWGGHTRWTSRRIFNNIFVQMNGLPGLRFPSPADDIQADGNLHWSADAGSTFQGDFFAAFRRSKEFELSKKQYPPGFGAHDVFGDPVFLAWPESGKKSIDLRLAPKSAALDTGVALPADWPDSLRQRDKGKPDIGALPLGAEPFRFGPRLQESP